MNWSKTLFHEDYWQARRNEYRDEEQQKNNNQQTSLEKPFTIWERWARFNENPIEKEQMKERARKTISFIHRNFLLKPGMSVLDIGAGGGVFSIPLAEKGLRVTTVDITPKTLDILQQSAQKKGLQIETYCADWEELELDQFGWHKKFDIVIASLTAAVSSEQSFAKLEKASRGVVYYSAFTKPQKNHYQNELLKYFSNKEQPQMNYDLLLCFNWLYTRGTIPSFEEYPVSFTKIEKSKDVIEECCNYYSKFKNLDEYDREIIRNTIESKAENGYVNRKTEMQVGSLLWQSK